MAFWRKSVVVLVVVLVVVVVVVGIVGICKDMVKGGILDICCISIVNDRRKECM